MTFEQLWEYLQQKYLGEAQRQQARDELRDYKQKEGESLQELASNVRVLSARGYPQLTPEQRDDYFDCSTFRDALVDEELRLQVALQRSKTLNEALNKARWIDWVLEDTRQRRERNRSLSGSEKKPENNIRDRTDSREGTNQLHTLMAQIAELKETVSGMQRRDTEQDEKICQLTVTVRNMQDESERSARENRELIGSLNRTRREVAALQKKTDEQNYKIMDARRESRELGSTISEGRRENLELRKLVDRSKASLEDLCAENRRLHSTVDSLQQEINAIRLLSRPASNVTQTPLPPMSSDGHTTLQLAAGELQRASDSACISPAPLLDELFDPPVEFRDVDASALATAGVPVQLKKKKTRKSRERRCSGSSAGEITSSDEEAKSADIRERTADATGGDISEHDRCENRPAVDHERAVVYTDSPPRSVPARSIAKKADRVTTDQCYLSSCGSTATNSCEPTSSSKSGVATDVQAWPRRSRRHKTLVFYNKRVYKGTTSYSSSSDVDTGSSDSEIGPNNQTSHCVTQIRLRGPMVRAKRQRDVIPLNGRGVHRSAGGCCGPGDCGSTDKTTFPRRHREERILLEKPTVLSECAADLGVKIPPAKGSDAKQECDAVISEHGWTTSGSPDLHVISC